MHISQPVSDPFSGQIHNQSVHNYETKQTYTSNKTVEELHPSMLPLLKKKKKKKKVYKTRTCWYRRPFHQIYRYQIKAKNDRETFPLSQPEQMLKPK